MEGGLQRGAGAVALGDAVVATLQIGAGAESTTGAGDHETAHIVAALVDFRQRFGETAEHVHGDGIHHFLMIEFQYGDIAVEIERDMFELHRFLAS